MRIRREQPFSLISILNVLPKQDIYAKAFHRLRDILVDESGWARALNDSHLGGEIASRDSRMGRSSSSYYFGWLGSAYVGLVCLYR